MRELEGALYHVMDRGTGVNDLRASADRQSREYGIETLAEACAKIGWQVHAYVLMPNHFHLVVKSPIPALRERRDALTPPCPAGSIGGPELLPPSVLRSLTNRWWGEPRALGDGTSRPSEPPVVSQRQSGEESP